MTTQRLKNKVCYITGAASGIGLACAQRCLAEGAIVAGADLNSSKEWQALPPDRTRFFELDVRNEQTQREAVTEIVKEYKRLDVAITAAGVPGGGAVHDLALEEWQRVIDINLTGTYLSCKCAIPPMLEQRSGSIVTIASIEGLEGTEGGSCYNASKGGVVLLTRNLANDYGRRNIRANAICPGFIDTPMLRTAFSDPVLKEYLDKIREQHKLGRLGKPEEVAAAALFLASEDASFVTGCALPVDGGFTAGHSTGMTKLLGLSD